LPVVSNEHFDDLMRLQELGFVQGAGGYIKETHTFLSNGSHAIEMNGLYIHVMARPGHSYQVPGVVANSKFRELVNVLSIKADISSANHVSKMHGFDVWADSVLVLYVGGGKEVIKGDPHAFDQLLDKER
jgi:hypothetical protein